MLKDAIRKLPPLYRFLSRAKQIIPRFGRIFLPYRCRVYEKRIGFHADPIWRYLVFSISEWFPISSCVETGSFKGDTTLFLVNIFPKVITYSIEIVNEYFKESTWRLRNFKNSLIIKKNSPQGIADLIKESKLGSTPFFFLDAHWYEYWPLPDELKEISKLDKAIIIIDDFKIEGRPEYGFDTYKAGDKDLPNDFNFISGSMTAKSYRYLLPKYRIEEAFPETPRTLRGYVVIFQNISEDEWQKVANSELVKSKYSTGIFPMR